MAAKKVLFLVGDFAADYEVMEPYQALTMLGYAVHAVCSGKVYAVWAGKKAGKKAAGTEQMTRSPNLTARLLRRCAPRNDR
jgi:putative intracellular protease/amidase